MILQNGGMIDKPWIIYKQYGVSVYNVIQYNGRDFENDNGDWKFLNDITKYEEVCIYDKHFYINICTWKLIE